MFDIDTRPAAPGHAGTAAASRSGWWPGVGRGLATLAAALFIALPVAAQEPAVAAGESAPQTVGELSFRITSLRVARPSSPATRSLSRATITLSIRNQGAQTVFLNALKGSAVLTNDLGYRWQEGYNGSVTGLDVAEKTRASLNNPIEPGAELRVQYSLRYTVMPGQSIGASYDFAAGFESLEDLGEGRLRKLREYSVAFTDVQRSDLAAAAGQELSDGVDEVMGALFGKRRRGAP